MKIRNILLAPILFVVMASGLFSCGVDRWPEYAVDIELDEWIDSVMRENYYWYSEMPSSKDLNYFVTPEKFLKSVLYTARDKNYSFVDTLGERKQVPSYGFNYTLYKNADIDTLYNALITYVLPHSPASQAGLVRGKWIVKVNNTFITKKNETKLLKSGEGLALTLGKYEMQKDKDGKDKGVVVITGTTQMEAERIVEDNPVNFYSIFTTTTGATVGYLVYSHFTAGTSSDKEKYNNELRQISKAFASAQVTHFILDLRYNTGGSLKCAQLMSSLLAPSDALGSTFAWLEYNDKQSAKSHELLFDKELIGAMGANMNIQQGIILSGSATEGVAGTMLDCLNPLGKWRLIGTSVKCPGVSTDSFINIKYNISLNPVVSMVFNSDDESNSGGSFTPNYSADETTDLVKFLPFGDKNEALLSIAIGVIDGTYPPKPEEKPKTYMIR